MSNEVTQHIEEALNEVRAIFQKAVDRIEAIPPGGKIPATKLADDLAEGIVMPNGKPMTGPQLYSTLKFLLDGYPGVKILRGAHGGIHRPLPAAAPVDSTKTDANNGGVQDETSNQQ